MHDLISKAEESDMSGIQIVVIPLKVVQSDMDADQQAI